MVIDDWTFAHLKREETLWGPHGYHRYPAKFIPQLVCRLIEAYSASGDLVGDPFLGSGTTGIEALRLGKATATIVSPRKPAPGKRQVSAGNPTLDLFGDAHLPEGMRYQANFLTVEEEQSLLRHAEGLPFKEFEFHGFTGKRRTVAELRPLAHHAGLEIISAAAQPSGYFVVECRPA